MSLKGKRASSATRSDRLGHAYESEWFLVTMRYNGKEYCYREAAYGAHGKRARQLLHERYEGGSHSCDCLRSDAIAEHCDSSFPALSCGTRIALVSIAPSLSQRRRAS
jgi:hypothetical protein